MTPLTIILLLVLNIIGISVVFGIYVLTEWKYLSDAHRVSKRTGHMQRGFHETHFFHPDSLLGPLETLALFNGFDTGTLWIDRWANTDYTYEQFKAEADEYNKIKQEKIANSPGKPIDIAKQKREHALQMLKEEK